MLHKANFLDNGFVTVYNSNPKGVVSQWLNQTRRPSSMLPLAPAFQGPRPRVR
jgi:hypothetical protein